MHELMAAMNGHDAAAMAALMADDYESSQPIHPGRGFGGSAQVEENWSAVFRGVPDFVAELVSWCAGDGVEWAEWHWHGHHPDGSDFAMRGVTIFATAGGLIQWGRLYMEPVDTSGQDISAAVQQLYRPSDS